MSEYLLELEDISKSFPGVRALEKVSMRIERGEVHALVGENGAGKSTLLNILCGVHHADSGSIKIDGHSVHIPNPQAAQRAGISMIHQELQQVPELTVAQNLFLGSPPKHFGVFTDVVKMRREARRVLSGLDSTINVSAPLKSLSVNRCSVSLLLSVRRSRPESEAYPHQLSSLGFRVWLHGSCSGKRRLENICSPSVETKRQPGFAAFRPVWLR